MEFDRVAFVMDCKQFALDALSNDMVNRIDIRDQETYAIWMVAINFSRLSASPVSLLAVLLWYMFKIILSFKSFHRHLCYFQLLVTKS